MVMAWLNTLKPNLIMPEISYRPALLERIIITIFLEPCPMNKQQLIRPLRLHEAKNLRVFKLRHEQAKDLLRTRITLHEAIGGVTVSVSLIK
jgi:hypothetical protein